jgi:peptidyl-prolyl cis-trans isomerase B (cyclophilin B)
MKELPMTDSAPAPTPAPAPAPAGAPTNVLAIIALIGAFVLAPVGIIVGHIALSQIKKTGENGRGLALAGTVLGYVFTALWLLFIVIGTILPLILFGTAVQSY